MSGVDQFLNQSAEWLRGSGPLSDIVLSSRLRLARNISGYPYLQNLQKPQKVEVIKKVKEAVSACPHLKDVEFFEPDDLTELNRQFLLERHLISRELANDAGENAAVITKDEVVSLMVLEEDHLRLQTFQSGFNLTEGWKIISQIDDELEKNLPYSFDGNLGYLTACPTNVGTGLRASCMLHLPGLVLTKQVQKVLQALSKLNLAVRGLYGEGTQATGNLFQFSNQITLGQREAEIIDNLACVIRQVIEHEKQARNYLKTKKKAKFEDQIWRALGTLKSARTISSQETTQLLSLVELGILIDLLKTDLTMQELNSLFLLAQPAHLQKLAHKSLTTAERDIRRADLIRSKLAKVGL